MLHIYSEAKFKKTGIMLAIEISIALILAFFISHIMSIDDWGLLPIPYFVISLVSLVLAIFIYGTIMHLIRMHFHRPQDNREEKLSQRFFCVLSGGIITAIFLIVMYIFLWVFASVASNFRYFEFIVYEDRNYIAKPDNVGAYVFDKDDGTPVDFHEVINPIFYDTETTDISPSATYIGVVEILSNSSKKYIVLTRGTGYITILYDENQDYGLTLDESIVGKQVEVKCEFTEVYREYALVSLEQVLE